MQQFNKFLQHSIKQAQQTIKTNLSGSLLQIILDRPKRLNAFTPGMYIRLCQILNKAKNDQQIGCVLLYGQGKSFSSGNDLSNFKFMPQDRSFMQQALQINRKMLLNLIFSISGFDKPLLAVCQGITVGFTFTMLPFFDRVWATSNATFQAPFVKILQGPQFGSSVLFPQLFGMKIAKEILLEGRKISSKQLQQLNFLDVKQTKQMCLQSARQCAKRYIAMDSTTLKACKRIISYKIDQVIKKQIQLLLERWADQRFIQLLMIARGGKL